MSSFSFIKDPDATLDYQVDWTLWLNGDTISNSMWIVPAGLTLEASVNTTATATAWLSGGTLNQKYEVVNRITTDGGRVDDRTIIIRIKEK